MGEPTAFGAIVTLYEVAAEMVIYAYSVNLGLSTSDATLTAAVAAQIPDYYRDDNINGYAHSQLQRLRDRIRVARLRHGPARNTRATARRLIEPLPADNHDQRVETIASRFEHVGIPLLYQNGRRVETIQYGSRYDRPRRAYAEGESLDEFWLGAVRAIRRVLHGLPRDQLVNIRLGSEKYTATASVQSGPTPADRTGELRLAQITPQLLSNALASLVQSDTSIEFHDIQFHITWYPGPLYNRLEAALYRPRNRPVTGRGRRLPAALETMVGLQDMPPEGNLCGIKVLVVGMDDVERKLKGERGTTLLNPRSSLLRQTRELAARLGIPPEQDYSSTEHYQKFVELYPKWRVVCVGAWRNPVDKHIWKGEEWELPAEETADWGRTIFIYYDGMERHFYRIPNYNFNNFGINNPRTKAGPLAGGTNLKTCRHCLVVMTRKTINKHKCENRHFCFPCNRWFSTTKWTEHQKGERKNCEKCGMACISLDCYKDHYSNCTGRNAHCRKCLTPLAATEIDSSGNPIDHECKFMRCNNLSCRAKMNGRQLDEHRCYISKIQPRKKRGALKRPRSDEPLIDDEAEEDEDDESSIAATEDSEAEEVMDLSDHWAWDCESMILNEKSGKVCTLEPSENSPNRYLIPVLLQLYEDGTEIINRVQIVNYVVAINIANYDTVEFTTIAEFVLWACNATRTNKWFFWSHNGAKYDTRLVWDYAVNNVPPEFLKKSIVMVGNRLFEFKMSNASFRDSYLHLPQKLSSLPKMFELGTGELEQRFGQKLKKGFFPYMFNTVDNQNYIGPLPDIDFYEPTKHKARDIFDPREDDEEGIKELHAIESARVQKDIDEGREGWNLQKELRAYCRMDTIILAAALRRWHELNENYCPPLSSLTLAGHAHKTLRAKFLPSGLVPVLKCFPQSLHKGPSREWKRSWDEERLARGAYFGGNTNCRSLFRELTEEQMEAGHKFVMDDIRSQYPYVMVDREYPVGDYKLYEYTTENQPKIEEVMAIHGDICCEIEYPSDKAPLFHPVLPRKRDGKLVYDLEACNVTPEEIAHWENRYDCDQRGYCQICKKMEGRALSTYTLVEVHKALEMGYNLIHTYWILGTHKMTRLIWKDYISCFYGLKLKHGKAPKDVNWDDEATVDEFIARHVELGIKIEAPQGGTVIEWFEPNEGLKAVAKLLLNSVYGKMGESSYKDTTMFVNSQYVEENLWRGDGVDHQIIGRDYFSETAAYRIRTRAPGPTLGKTNVMVAGYVTAHGRLLLWEIMNKYGTDVLYHDTDSVIIHVRPPSDRHYEPPPKTGPYLGDLEREVDDAHAFVSNGPKSYAIKYWRSALPKHYHAIEYSQEQLQQLDPEVAAGIVLERGEGMVRWNARLGRMEYEYVKQRNKGVVLDSDTAKKLNYETMRMMVWKMHGWMPGEASITTSCTDFIWQKENSKMFVRHGYKTITLTKASLKGKLGSDGFTLYPFGAERFPQWELEDEDAEEPLDEEWEDIDEGETM